MHMIISKPVDFFSFTNGVNNPQKAVKTNAHMLMLPSQPTWSNYFNFFHFSAHQILCTLLFFLPTSSDPWPLLMATEAQRLCTYRLFLSQFILYSVIKLTVKQRFKIIALPTQKSFVERTLTAYEVQSLSWSNLWDWGDGSVGKCQHEELH